MKRYRPGRPWHLYLLGLVAVVVAVLAGLEVGPPSSSARTSQELITAEQGVVQSTVTATGNLEPGTDVDANFATSGTLEHVYVKVGQYVTKGQLLATLDPTSAQLGVEQADESLTSAEDQLTAAQNGTSTGSSGSGSSSNTSYTGPESPSEFVSFTRKKPPTGTTSPSRPTTTTPKRSTSGGSSKPRSSAGSGSSRSGSTGNGSSGAGAAGSGTPTQTTTAPNPATIASAQASVYGAEANLRTAQQTLSETKLTAPTSGTVVSVSDLVGGDSVSGGATTTGAASSSSSSNSSSSGGLAGGSSSAGSLGSSSSSSSSSNSSPFVEIVNSHNMTMTVSFSESDISKVHVGQPATVTLDALSGVELAAHVTQISDVGSSSSGVVSYDATLTVNQRAANVKPGMSASASVIVGQAQGVTVPNEAVTGTGSEGTVNLYQNGKTVSQQVVVGLRGTSRTQIISGLSAGQQLAVTITLPSLGTSSSSSSSSSRGTLGGGLSGGGFPGGGGGFFGGGGAGAFFRRGGG